MGTNEEQRGSAFRDRVATILRARYGNATTEAKVGGKDADVVFAIPYPGGRPMNVAVECKDWKKPLRSNDITSIFHSYGPAFASNSVDSLWIVAPLDIRAEQRETISQYGIKLRFFTFETLVHQIFDFSPYLNFLVTDFHRDGLDQYYVMPRTDRGRMLHRDVIVPWLDGKSKKPIAIIADYGSGKTSYAKFLASTLAIKALSDPFEPKPILVQLSQLTRQQSLRGLINNLFSDEFNIDGYNYRLFQLLFEQGSFVLILDGFDEMKHAMKTRDIAANFEMIKEFTKGNRSRYLLLGRPDPFVTIDDEVALRGGMRVGAQIIPDNSKPQFSIVGLAEFTEVEVKKFLVRFLEVKLKEARIKGAKKFVEKRVNEIRSRPIMDIIKRPVHAKMLAVLAASPDWRMEASTEYDLYQHFVMEFLRRELSEKDARAAVPEKDRKIFMEQIAWWLWTKRKKISFSIEQVPNYIVDRVREHFEPDETDENILREMLIGSLLGRRVSTELILSKDEFSFYFPHKSYWEFLVSEFIASDNFGRHDLGSLISGATSEILKFLNERRERQFVTRLYDLIRAYRDLPLDFKFLEFWSRSIQWDKDDLAKRLDAVTDFSSLSFICAAAIAKRITFLAFREKLEATLKSGDEELVTASIMFANLYASSVDRICEDGMKYVLDVNCRLLARIINLVGATNFLTAKNTGKAHVVPSKVSRGYLRVFNEGIHPKGDGTRDYIEFGAFQIASILNQALRSGTFQKVDIAQMGTSINVIRIELDEFLARYTLDNIRGALSRAFRGSPKPRLLSAQDHQNQQDRVS